jgi:DNA repair exonuclease SbcCD nuclease subunit
MRITIIADLHLKTIDVWGIAKDGINSRLLDRINTLNFCVKYAIDNKVDCFVIAGDIFDKMNPSEYLRKIFVETVIIPLVKFSIPIIIVVGNHDTNFSIANFETEALLLDTAKEGSLIFVSQPTIVYGMYIIPYGYPIPKDNENCKILIGHHGIAGAETGVGVRQRPGEECTLSDFEAFEYSFLGHYHKGQLLFTPDNKNKVYYISSTNIWDMGERTDKKRLLDVYIDDDFPDKIEVSSVILPERKFIQLEILEGESWEFTENIKDACVKLVYRGSKSWLNSLDFDSIRRAHEQFSPHKVIPEVKVIQDVSIIKKIDVENKTLSEIVIEQCKLRKLSDEDIKFGLDIFNGVVADD